MQIQRITVGLFALVLLVGCGDGRPTLVTATGSVTLNGQPVDGALVGFQPQGIKDYNRPSTATTDEQGNFTVGTFGKGDGIPVGTYRVSVRKMEIISKLPEDFNSEEPEANDRPVRARWHVPRKYGHPDQSGVTVEVTADGISPAVIALEGSPEDGMLSGGGGDA